jgi:tetratricopeptide (TPR) repeat protein
MPRRPAKAQRPNTTRATHAPDRAERRHGSDGAAAAAPPWKIWGAVALLVGAVFAAYANSFHGPFIFDDGPSIVGNPSIRHLGSFQVLAAPPDSVTTTGRPILNLSLAINYALGGLTVEGYHVVNLIIHMLAGLTLFGLLRRTLLLPALASRFAAASTGLALAMSLLWAVHPLQTESVTYVVQRAESLVGLFYLLTLYCYLRGATAERGAGWYVAAVLSCVLGMGSKEVMVSAPLVVVLFDRIFIAGSFQQGARQRWRVWGALLATWAVLALAVLLSHGRGGSAGFGLGMSAWSYARTQFGCILHYLCLSLWPSPLVIDYGNSVVSKAVNITPHAFGVLVLVAATVVGLVRRPMLGFLGVCFFAILAPSSSVVPLAGQTEAEHRMYLPLAALVVLVVLAAHSCLTMAMGRRGLQYRRAITPLLTVVAVALGVATYRRNETYRTELSVWDDTVRHGPPNSRAFMNRGNALMTNGQAAAAIEDYDQSIRLDPLYAKAYNARGNAYTAEGRYDEALRDYEKAIKLKPELADAYNGRGSAYGNLGQVDAAIQEFSRAIELSPEYEEAYYNRGCALNVRGQVDEAIEDFSRAIRLRSDYADAFNRRGSAYDKKGQVDAAISDYDQTICLRPDLAEAYNNRGGAYELKGQLDAAIKDYDKAIALQPGFVEVYSNRGNAYQAKGQFHAAIKDYDKAIALKPDFVVAFQNRAIAYSQTKDYDKARADVSALLKLGGTPTQALVEELAQATGGSQ